VLIQQRSFVFALANTVGSVILGQLAVVVGMMLARLL
jgi:fluoride ion exporter CrcB/FEX